MFGALLLGAQFGDAVFFSSPLFMLYCIVLFIPKLEISVLWEYYALDDVCL